jgi:hypothetical protein
MDKRGRERKKTHLTARFGQERPDKLGLVTNVSHTGVYLSTNAVLAPGAIIHMDIEIREGVRLSLRGKVTRVKRVHPSLVTSMRGGMGVLLEDPPPNWRESLLGGEA